ncbi:hypothetical protein [Deinococcus multiflagellatus]|uniref:hypothetical protein n=1 Tax=Deinococcus multiflagellatus TaxID=1656887 RepID=UPI001CCB1358|nr:hypothetical protein [Deinococcus multiflagellatus]MBZ9711761.1 hypothetical protein [Deinococcus multiflagellatus]
MIALRPAHLLLLLLPLPLAGALAVDTSYYPKRPGMRWTYSSGETQVVGAPVVHRGVSVTPVSHQFGQTVFTQDLLEHRADGSVWLRGVNTGGRLTWYTPPLNIYPPGPLRPGQTWTGVTAGLRQRSTVVGVAPLRTSAGAYNTLKIRTETTAAGKLSVQTTYFVPTVGVVRYETADGSVIDLVK